MSFASACRPSLAAALLLAGLSTMVACAGESADDAADAWGGAGHGGTGDGPLDDTATGAGGAGGGTGADEDAGADGSTGGDAGTGDTGADTDPETPTEADEGLGAPTDQDGACDAISPVHVQLDIDDSNAVVSPVQAREAILDGWNLLTAVPIRTYEFFNYYSFAYPTPTEATVDVQAALEQVQPSEYRLQVAATTAALEPTDRPPVHLTLLLDTTESMEGQPMSRLKDVGRAIAAALKAGDRISLVTWNPLEQPLLENYQVGGPNDLTLLAHIEALEADGIGEFLTALTDGYELARLVSGPDSVDRMVVISDGLTEAEPDDLNLVAQKTEASGDNRLYLAGVGVGTAETYDTTFADELAQAGKGSTLFIGSAQEAWKAFKDEFVSTFLLAALDVQVQVTLPAGFDVVPFAGDAEPEPEMEPQHLAPNDSMVLHRKLVTCAPALLETDDSVTITITYVDPGTGDQTTEVLNTSVADLLGTTDPLLLKGAAVLAYARGLQSYKRAVEDGDAGGKQRAVDDALAALERAEAKLPDDGELAEIRAVLEAL